MSKAAGNMGAERGTAHLNIVADQIFLKDAGGTYYSTNGAGTEFWRRYLATFGTLSIITRVRPVTTLPAAAMAIDDPRISFVDIPYYRGPLGYLGAAGRVRRMLLPALDRPGAFILRLPGTLPGIASRRLVKAGRGYGTELIGDPSDVFATGGVGGLAAPLWRLLFTRSTRRTVAAAAAASYVNSGRLPTRFPSGEGAFRTHYSNVELPPQLIVPAARTGEVLGPVFHMLLVGTLEQKYKGFDVFIDAAAELKQRGATFRATIAGEGRFKASLEEQAASRGVGDEINFVGRVSRDEIFALLDRSDLLVMPSRTEGLPRAMIEAMARGVPCIGTDVGGIPELLDERHMVSPDRADALAALVERVMGDPAERAAMSRRNIEMARDYVSDILDLRRRQFYEATQAASERPRG